MKRFWNDRRESQALWAIIAVVIGIDALWAWSIGVRIAFNAVAVSGVIFASGIGYVYANIRPNPRLAALASACSQLIAFMVAAVVLSYLAVTTRFPLVDSYLSAGDAAIGFDWLSSFNWVQDHPAIERALGLAYNSLAPQTCLLLIILSLTCRFDRLREFLWLFVLTLLIAISLSWLFPAESAWVYFGVTDRVDAYHLADFTALRNGDMAEIVMSRTSGLITFPSFHAALALILIYATRGIRFLFPLSFGLNVLMIASTPSAGGHYLVDVFAGLALVPLSIFILRSWQRPTELVARRTTPRTRPRPTAG